MCSRFNATVMIAVSGKCDWVCSAQAEVTPSNCELCVILAQGILRQEIDAQLGERAVRLEREGCSAGRSPACELALPGRVLVENASVRWHARRHELRFMLPWASPRACTHDCSIKVSDTKLPAGHLAVVGSAAHNDVAQGLQLRSYHVADCFLGDKLGQRLAKKVRCWFQGGRMRPGVVGTSAAPVAPLPKVRGDVILNLDENEDSDVSAVLRRFDALVLSLGSQLPALRRVTQRSRAMVAVYPAGSHGYLRHVDNPRTNPLDRRRLTCIYYLNFDWSSADGGNLRLHLRDGDIDVEPRGDRFVCFWSDLVSHEVLSAKTDRAAISAWYSEVDETPGVQLRPPLPVPAVHAFANYLECNGFVRFPTWMLQSFSAEEFATAAQALRLSALASADSAQTHGACRQVVGKGTQTIHDALVALCEEGAECYCNTSQVLSNCACCAERFLAMLVDAQAPGWRHKLKSAPKAIVLVRLTKQTGSPVQDVALQPEHDGATLGCCIGLMDGLEVAVRARGSSARVEHVPLAVGDVVLVQMSRIETGSRWRQEKPGGIAATSLLGLEVWI